MSLTHLCSPVKARISASGSPQRTLRGSTPAAASSSIAASSPTLQRRRALSLDPNALAASAAGQQPVQLQAQALRRSLAGGQAPAAAAAAAAAGAGSARAGAGAALSPKRVMGPGMRRSASSERIAAVRSQDGAADAAAGSLVASLGSYMPSLSKQ